MGVTELEFPHDLSVGSALDVVLTANRVAMAPDLWRAQSVRITAIRQQ